MLSKIKQALDDLNADLKALWIKDRLLIIGTGALLIFIKFRELLINILVSSSKDVFQNAQKKNDKLQQQENQASQQGDALQQEANELPSKNSPVTDPNWYKKE